MAARSRSGSVTAPIRRGPGTVRRAGALLPALVLLVAACQSKGPAPAGPDAVPEVRPAMETTPVGRTGDAADDPAILITDRDTVWLAGTDKQVGLRIYNLQGDEIHVLKTGRLNNVDAVALDDGAFLVAASNRTTPAIDLYLAQPDRDRIALVNRIPLDFVDPYGLCMATMAGRISVFVGDKTGIVQRWALDDEHAGSMRQVYTFDSQTEGCVVDTETNTLYVGEEIRGIWAVAVDTGAQELLAAVDDVSLVADVEGLDIYRDAAHKLLVASSQGDSSYVVYSLPEGEELLKFRVGRNEDLGIDGTADTDGIAISSRPMPGYPAGAMVVQDGYNTAVIRNQNFKLIDWREIETLLDRARK